MGNENAFQCLPLFLGCLITEIEANIALVEKFYKNDNLIKYEMTFFCWRSNNTSIMQFGPITPHSKETNKANCKHFQFI